MIKAKKKKKKKEGNEHETEQGNSEQVSGEPQQNVDFVLQRTTTADMDTDGNSHTDQETENTESKSPAHSSCCPWDLIALLKKKLYYSKRQITF